MPYHRILNLDFLTNTEYDALADDFETRFIQGKEDDCWPWMGGTAKHGRGQVVLDGQTVPAPRVAYLLYVGDIHDDDSHHGICVLHECDNPPCVDPKHLFLGTQLDNMRDKARKGRQPRRYRKDPTMAQKYGTEHYRAQLTEDEIRAIRKDPRRSREIAEAYNISQSVVCNIKSYRVWAWLPAEPDDVPVTLRRTENWRKEHKQAATANG